MSESHGNIMDLWRGFNVTRSEELRNRLILEYVPLVEAIAERICARLPAEFELDDLIQAGFFGLKDAVESFDQERGVKFETYASPRIRGSILDELRRMDWVPRLVRSRSCLIGKTARMLEIESGKPPSSEEVRAELRLSEHDYEMVIGDSRVPKQVGFELSDGGDRGQEEDGYRHPREVSVFEDWTIPPEETPTRRELVSFLIQGLPESERFIFLLHFSQGITLKEIGHYFSRSERRISQICQAAIVELRKRAEEIGLKDELS